MSDENGRELNPDGFPQISVHFHMFTACYARGLHSATKFTRPKGANRASNSGCEARCQGCGGDLNTATKDQLLSLPGVTAAEADRVIAGRPYSEAGDVVTRRIMPKAEYDKIADRVTAKK